MSPNVIRLQVLRKLAQHCSDHTSAGIGFQLWNHQYKRDMDILGEGCPAKCHCGIKSLGHFSCEERFKKLGLFSLDKRWFRRESYQCMQRPEGRLK